MGGGAMVGDWLGVGGQRPGYAGAYGSEVFILALVKILRRSGGQRASLVRVLNGAFGGH